MVILFFFSVLFLFVQEMEKEIAVLFFYDIVVLFFFEILWLLHRTWQRLPHGKKNQCLAYLEVIDI